MNFEICHNRIRQVLLSLGVLSVVLVNLASCQDLDDIYVRLDKIETKVTDIQSAALFLQEAYSQAKIIKSVSPLEEERHGWIVTFTDNTEIVFLDGLVADIDKDETTDVVIIKLTDGRSFWFNTHYVIPLGIAVLSTRPVALSYGKRDTIEFRVNPSNASFKMSGDNCQIELDKIASVPSRSSYVTAPDYYKLIGVEQVYDGLGRAKVGQYRAIIEDSKVSADYDEMSAMVLNVKDANDKDVQISSSAFDVCGKNYDNLPKTGLPVVIINTPNSVPIISKEVYIEGTDVTVLNADMTYQFQGGAKIKGRGNATWTSYPKKPYAIKLEEKTSLFGFPQSKKWTLLAEFCDKSMLRTAFMLEMSKACDLKYTVNYQHIELILNGQYEGTYILTEKVEKDKNRVNIQQDGFIIENNGYAQFEPLCFKTTFGKLMYSFKYPDPDDSIVEGDDNYNYISAFMNDFERALYSKEFTDEENGYRCFIDSKSFAKWYILMELLGNVDPNKYYVLEEKGAKLEMYPAWDAEWSLGLGWQEKWQWVKNQGEPMPFDKAIYNGAGYSARLLQDSNFRADIKSEWNNIKTRIPEALTNLQILRNSLRKAQEQNFARWPILGTYQSVETVTFDTWEEEADFVFDYFELRYNWFDTYINNLE